jgi:alkylhydroperoxidase family enzyme
MVTRSAAAAADTTIRVPRETERPLNDHYAVLVHALRRAVLESDAHTDPSLRSAVEGRAAVLGGRTDGAPGEVPATLQEYVDAVARCAWKVTDADVAALRRAGYSEDAIFEITVSAALGAAAGRLERAYAALRGEV